MNRSKPVISAALLWIGLAAPPPAAVQTVEIDGQAEAHPFPHSWEQGFGSGRAAVTLRESWRRSLERVRAITGCEYIRFHAIFHDENGVYSEDNSGRPAYNFNRVDEIYDGLLARGVKPYVELSFMPRQLAAKPVFHSFWYKPVIAPPKEYSQWGAFVEAFARHLTARYGLDEVAKWYFEVWNEPNIDFWAGEPKFDSYMELYAASAKALKRVSPRLRAGGPATAQAAWTGRFLNECARRALPADFVSTHVYANDRPGDVFGQEGPIDRRTMLSRAVDRVYREVKRSARPDVPIHWSEFNASYMNEVDVTDSAFMGPWLAETIARTSGKAQMLMYWSISDVFEEQGVFRSPFYGGFGLVNAQGVPKPAFHAFRVLHMLGSERLPCKAENVLVTRKSDGRLVVAAWNYAEPGRDGEERVFEFMGAPGGAALLHRVDRLHGSALERWKLMGRPASLSVAQERELKAVASAPAPERVSVIGGRLQIAVPAPGLVVIELGLE